MLGRKDAMGRFAASILVLLLLLSVCRAAVKDAVVRVSVPSGNGNSLGSGVLSGVDEEYGYILTAHHVVRGASGHPTVIFPNGQRAGGRTVQVDAVFDLALIKIRKPDVEPVPVGADPQRGERLVACGYGSGQYRETVGVLTQREFPMETMHAPVLDWYSINSPVRPGDSGGPVFNSQGQLVGILWGANDNSTTASTVRRLTQFAQCYGPNCVMPPRGRSVGIGVGVYPGPAPIAQPQPTPKPVPSQVPQTTLVKIAEFDKRLKAIEISVAQWKAIPGPAGPAGPTGPSGPKGDAGKEGNCTCDVDRLADQVEANLRLKPIKVEILDEAGEIAFRQDVYLGGEPLQLQLIPKQK